jgi:hypothetical protein
VRTERGSEGAYHGYGWPRKRVVTRVDPPTAERGSKEDAVAVDLVAGDDGAATDRRAVAGEGHRGTRRREGSSGGVGPVGKAQVGCGLRRVVVCYWSGPCRPRVTRTVDMTRRLAFLADAIAIT